MAIEILSPGISNLDFRFVGRCTKCQGRFRWGLGDAYRTASDRTSSVIRCPTPDCIAEKVYVRGIPSQITEA